MQGFNLLVAVSQKTIGSS